MKSIKHIVKDTNHTQLVVRLLMTWFNISIICIVNTLVLYIVKHYVKYDKISFDAIFTSYGPTFGRDADLYIRDQLNSSKKSYATIGFSYCNDVHYHYGKFSSW